MDGMTLYFRYDNMGNPVLYKGSSNTDTASLVWAQGRKTQSGTLNGKSFAYKYDSNGMRYSKTVGGVTTEYYLAGDTILAESNTNTQSLTYYLYDMTGICGMVYNGGRYYFQNNLYGDVVGIYTTSGACVGMHMIVWLR